MNRLLSILLLAAAIAAPANAALQAGDSAPEFTAQASQNGKAFAYSLKNALNKGPVAGLTHQNSNKFNELHRVSAGFSYML
jgi:hypothetical protein